MNTMTPGSRHVFAVKATFDGEKIVLPDEVRGVHPGKVIVIFEDAADSEEDTLWLKAQEVAFAKTWDNPEDEVYDRL